MMRRFLVLLALVAVAATVAPIPPLMPPEAPKVLMTPKAASLFSGERMARTYLVIPPATQALLSWDLPPKTNGIYFRVERSTDLASWSLFANTRSNSMTVPFQGPYGFFRVASYQTGVVTLAWSPSPDSDIVTGYRLYQATETVTNTFDCGLELMRVVAVVGGESNRFWATAYDTNAVESEPSNTVGYQAAFAVAPANVRITIP